ncbi:signal recognition particle receptor family protein [Salix suchowensis]|nr:signal recognition particle receptor family protein [Salix suchowensis]
MKSSHLSLLQRMIRDTLLKLDRILLSTADKTHVTNTCLREDIFAGKLKSGSEIKKKGNKTKLRLVFRIPAVVNGGGKTTSLGKLAYRLKKAGEKILMAAGDTFRAATSDQLDIWAERTGCEIVALKKGKEQEFDTVLRLHTNYSLMEELIAYKKVVGKIVRGTLNVVGNTGFILTKLDGSARSSCVVCSSGIPLIVSLMSLASPVKFVGVEASVEGLQPSDAGDFLNAIFSKRRSCRR